MRLTRSLIFIHVWAMIIAVKAMVDSSSIKSSGLSLSRVLRVSRGKVCLKEKRNVVNLATSYLPSHNTTSMHNTKLGPVEQEFSLPPDSLSKGRRTLYMADEFFRTVREREKDQRRVISSADSNCTTLSTCKAVHNRQNPGIIHHAHIHL